MRKNTVGNILDIVIKLLLFLAFCAGAAYLCGRFVPEKYAFAAVPISAAVISWVFLTYIEEGKRSFFAKGYLLENVIIGFAAGAAVFCVACAVEWLTGDLVFRGFADNFDIGIPFNAVCSHELFAGIVIFGCFFHIIRMDMGTIPAVVLSSVLYGLFGAFDRFGAFIVPDNEESIISLSALLLTGAAAGLIQLRLGDVRSSCAFLAVQGFTDRSLGTFLLCYYKGRSLNDEGISLYSIPFCAVMLVFCVYLTVTLWKKK